ncbi:MAG: tetratricopeptide repeat protein [Sphingopyxis sp.]|nr:tetratricopeptide repeat protein [Sphingopyxis sp.]
MDRDDSSTAPQAAEGPAPQAAGGKANWLVIGASVLALAGALGYALTRDGLPTGEETQAVSAAATGSLSELEARVAANPDDLDAWGQLGQQRFDTSDYDGAVEAYRNATRLAPAVAAYWSALGETLVMAAPRGGPPMPDDATAAFRRAIGIDADDPRARYFLAVKKDIDGDHEGAISDWLALLADTPQGAPWEQDLRRTIEQVGARESIAVASRIAAVRQPTLSPNELPVAARAIPGPTRDQMQDAAQLPKGQQDMMIQGMVDGLETKLRDNPGQPDRWIMLMRSRMTLGESAKAAEALRAAIAANPSDEARLRAQARLLGVPGA